MKRLVLWFGGFALVLLLVLWVVWPQRSGDSGPAVVAPQLESRDVVLYFADPAGVALVSEERKIAGCNEERQCIAQTIEALAQGSDRLFPIISERTRVLGVEITDDLVRVNFSRDLVNLHPGGNMSELLTVYGLVNTLAVNFPALHRLQILIEGEVALTLKGHVDISRPVKAEFRYIYVPGVEEDASLSEDEGPQSPPE